MNWETILFLGDSLTFGARSYLGFPEYTGNILSTKLSKDWNVVNHSTNGYRAVDLARSISDNYATLASQNPVISVILIGTNDAKASTTNEEYRIALEQIIIKVKLITLNKNILILKIPDLVAGVAYPYNVEMNHIISGYNQIIEELAEKHQAKALFIPLESQHFFDGVHFNKEGTFAFAAYIANHIMKERGY